MKVRPFRGYPRFRDEPRAEEDRRDDEPTLVACPLCATRGYVHPDVRATFEQLTREARERA